MDAVGRVDASGILGEGPRRQMQHGVRQCRIITFIFVLELADIVGQHDTERLNTGETLLEIFAVALDGSTESPEVHPVGADADGTAPAAGAERKNLVKAIEQP